MPHLDVKVSPLDGPRMPETGAMLPGGFEGIDARKREASASALM